MCLNFCPDRRPPEVTPCRSSSVPLVDQLCAIRAGAAVLVAFCHGLGCGRSSTRHCGKRGPRRVAKVAAPRQAPELRRSHLRRCDMNGRDVLMGATLGSTLMFLLDPNGGRRRRALMRDQFTRASRKTRDGLDATARDMTNRAGGIVAAARGKWSDNQVDDQRLVARVRAKLGRVCSHPHAIDLEAQDGTVTLRGPVLASEVNDI